LQSKPLTHLHRHLANFNRRAQFAVLALPKVGLPSDSETAKRRSRCFYTKTTPIEGVVYCQNLSALPKSFFTRD